MSQPMTVGEMVALLTQIADKVGPDTPLVVSSDPEGNSFNAVDSFVSEGQSNGNNVLVLWSGYPQRQGVETNGHGYSFRIED